MSTTKGSGVLWWTAMLIITMGSDFWPQTAEGRPLTFLLLLYGFAMFGYITASFATFFIREASSAKRLRTGRARSPVKVEFRQ